MLVLLSQFTLMICGGFFLWRLTILNSSRNDVFIPAESDICKLKISDLPSIIWSHRARVPGNSVDGSAVATSKLLSGGIRNFDVDVSIVTSHSDESRFIVAHPAALNASSNILDFQTVFAFLEQVFEVTTGVSDVSSRYVAPMVTLEPKFDNVNDLKMLLGLLETTSMGKLGRAAVICKNRKELRVVMEFYSGYNLTYLKHIAPYSRSVAIAFRSVHTSSNDFAWNLCERFGSKKSLLRLCDGSARADASDSGMQSVFRQVNMPDIKLIRSSASVGCDDPKYRSLRTSSSTPRKNVIERDAYTTGDPIVSWVIDKEEELWEALRLGSDSVISNNPIELRNALYRKYDKECSR